MTTVDSSLIDARSGLTGAAAEGRVAAMSEADAVQRVMHQGEQSAWTTAALSLALSAQAAGPVLASARDVLSAAGLDLDEPPAGLDPAGAAAQAAAPLFQTAEVLRGGGSWGELSDDALIAQGRASAQGAEAFLRIGLPVMPGLAEALARPGARMLDVGVGVGALAVAYAEALPQVTVIGLDVLPRVLDIARRTVAQSDVADRVELREQSVGDLDDVDAFDFAWVPAPFVPPDALRAGIAAIARALRPGGWVIVGHGKFSGDPLDDALTRFKTVIFGGTVLDGAAACELLTGAGLAGAMTMPTPPGAPAVTIARRPPAAAGDASTVGR